MVPTILLCKAIRTSDPLKLPKAKMITDTLFLLTSKQSLSFELSNIASNCSRCKQAQGKDVTLVCLHSHYLQSCLYDSPLLPTSALYNLSQTDISHQIPLPTLVVKLLNNS